MPFGYDLQSQIAIGYDNLSIETWSLKSVTMRRRFVLIISTFPPALSRLRHVTYSTPVGAQSKKAAGVTRRPMFVTFF